MQRNATANAARCNLNPGVIYFGCGFMYRQPHPVFVNQYH